MTGNLNAALVLVNKLNEAYFLHRNLEIILSCFSADAHVVGVSTGEVSNGLEDTYGSVQRAGNCALCIRKRDRGPYAAGTA